MTIAILLCTFNGAKYLQDQLDSFDQQTMRDWRLYVSDDGSTDQTKDILQQFASKYEPGKVAVWQGPGSGFSDNFLSLICSDLDADYFAISDQDDIWTSDKLHRAIEALGVVASGTPALYGSRTILIDEQGQPLGLSPDFKHQPDLRNALVQTMAGGNTMVMNAAARNLLLIAGADVNVYAHDWWISLVVAACDGRLIYDREPSLRYRQHGQNQLGSNKRWRNKWTRMKKLMRGDFHQWNDRNLHALERLRGRISVENQALLDDYSHWRKAGLFDRLSGLRCSRLWRQNWDGQLALWLAALMGRL